VHSVRVERADDSRLSRRRPSDDFIPPADDMVSRLSRRHLPSVSSAGSVGGKCVCGCECPQ